MADEKNILKSGERRIRVAEEGRFRQRIAAAVFSGSLFVAPIFGCGSAVNREPAAPAVAASAADPSPTLRSDIKEINAGEEKGGNFMCSVGRINYHSDYAAGILSEKRVMPTAEGLATLIQDLKRRGPDDGQIDTDEAIMAACLVGKLAEKHPELDYSAAIPELVKLLGDQVPELRTEAEKALGKIGDPSALSVSIRNGNTEAVEGIMEKNPGHKEGIVSLLAAILADADAEGKAAAARTIGKLAETHPELDYAAPVLELVKIVGGPASDAKTEAGRALSSIRSDGILEPSGIPVLISMLGADDAWTRNFTGDAIGKFYPKDEKGKGSCLSYDERIKGKFGKKGLEVFDLIDGKRTAESIMKKAGLSEAETCRMLEYMEQLGAIKLDYPGGKRPEARVSPYSEETKESYLKGQVYNLVDLLKKGTWQQRQGAAIALGEIGDGETTDALIAAMRDESVEVKKSAADALGKFAGPCALYYLANRLDDKNDEMRQQSAEAIGKIAERNPLDSEVEFAVDMLMLAAKEPWGEHWSASTAASALGKIGAAAKGKSKKIYEKVFSGIMGLPYYSEETLDALGNMGDRRAVPILIGILEREDGYWSERAYTWEIVCSALGRIGDPRATDVIAKMLGYTEDVCCYDRYEEKIRVQARIGWALGKMGDDAVFRALEKGGREVRRGVIIGLRYREGDRVVPALIKALDDEGYEVKEEAEHALRIRLRNEKTDEETKAEISRALERHKKASDQPKG